MTDKIFLVTVPFWRPLASPLTTKKVLEPKWCRNAWQSLAYSTLGAVVSPPSVILMKTLSYWSRDCLTAPPPNDCSWTKCGKVFDAGRTTSYLLNFVVTEPNLTKISHKVESWWSINTLKSEFQKSAYPNFIRRHGITKRIGGLQRRWLECSDKWFISIKIWWTSVQ